MLDSAYLTHAEQRTLLRRLLAAILTLAITMLGNVVVLIRHTIHTDASVEQARQERLHQIETLRQTTASQDAVLHQQLIDLHEQMLLMTRRCGP